jgi:hypothetical protein
MRAAMAWSGSIVRASVLLYKQERVLRTLLDSHQIDWWRLYPVSGSFHIGYIQCHFNRFLSLCRPDETYSYLVQ